MKIDKIYINQDNAAFFIDLVFEIIEVSRRKRIAKAHGFIESASAAGANTNKNHKVSYSFSSVSHDSFAWFSSSNHGSLAKTSQVNINDMIATKIRKNLIIFAYLKSNN